MLNISISPWRNKYILALICTHLTGSQSKSIMIRRGEPTLQRSLGLLTTVLQRQKRRWRAWERQKEESFLRYYLCASSAKNAVPVAQAPCQHRMTEGTVHRITVQQGGSEKGRERIDVECDSIETESEEERQSEKRYKDPKDRSKKAERANTNRVIAAQLIGANSLQERNVEHPKLCTIR